MYGIEFKRHVRKMGTEHAAFFASKCSHDIWKWQFYSPVQDREKCLFRTLTCTIYTLLFEVNSIALRHPSQIVEKGFSRWFRMFLDGFLLLPQRGSKCNNDLKNGHCERKGITQTLLFFELRDQEISHRYRTPQNRSRMSIGAPAVAKLWEKGIEKRFLKSLSRETSAN